MNFLTVLSVIAVAAAHPLPEDCDTAVLVQQGTLPYLATPQVAPLAYGHLGQYAGLPSYAQTQYAGVPSYAQTQYAGVPSYAQYAAIPSLQAAHLTYAAAPTPVALPPAEVKIPITHTHVEVPVHQQVHYGSQSYVAGATTAIHKPALAAPAIAPPSVLLSKITHNAPELTVKTQEVPVERHTPNFVDTPYHAGTIVQYTEPEVREYKVPTPVAQPIPVPHPVPVVKAVPVPTPVHTVAVHQAPFAVAPAAAVVAVAVDDC
ncbi:hypothetical protein Pcinc_028576 [Petrolisthes cinctipes]|uniref:Uncharacterized protein n=1 Tax=Petrolisthes cinctipes TaxID=88211 RepID=A0AAE1F2R1_PETCI|nr:hypothetical protein Pcinc_028574 [Petrolisthes cinctipes]KAK3865832.1 hypothetical protein Pcinc_028576 [Petrolisthes cinctipes]